jgi:hypothetical protein
LYNDKAPEKEELEDVWFEKKKKKVLAMPIQKD